MGRPLIITDKIFAANPFTKSLAGQKVLSHMSFRYRCLAVLVVPCILFAAGCGSPASTDSQSSVSGAVKATQHPLVAQYSVGVSADAQVSVEFGTDTNYGRSTSPQPASAHSIIALLVAGMRPATTYHMRAQVTYASGATVYDSDHTFTTGPLPSNMVSFPHVTLAPGSSSSVQGVDQVSALGPGVTATVFDKDGSLIWYYYDSTLPPLTFPLRFLPNGHFLVQYYQNIREVDLTGKTVREEKLAQLNSDLKAAGYAINAANFTMMSSSSVTDTGSPSLTSKRTIKTYRDIPAPRRSSATPSSTWIRAISWCGCGIPSTTST